VLPFFFFFGIFWNFFPNMTRVMVFTFGMLSDKILQFPKYQNNQALKSKILDISDTHLSVRHYGMSPFNFFNGFNYNKIIYLNNYFDIKENNHRKLVFDFYLPVYVCVCLSCRLCLKIRKIDRQKPTQSDRN